MNLGSLQTELGELEKFNLVQSLEKSQQSKIKDIVRQQVIDLSKNFEKNNAVTSVEFNDNTVNITSSNSLNLISETIQDYFGSENNYFSNNKILGNSSGETQVQDFQHSSICGCFACCSNPPNAQNNATQGDRYFENIAFFNAGGSKWSQPGGKGNPVYITYSLGDILDGGLNGISAEQVEAAIEEAFGVWSEVAPLNFTEVEDSSNSQIRIGYEYIDGQNGTLAYAYFPTNGDITFDSGENWNTSLFLETAVHEIGHSLGLDHENGTDAIMNPSIQNRYNGLGSAFLLQDDINGIRSIYGNASGSVNPLDGTPTNPDPTPEPTPTPSGPIEINGTSGNDILMGNDSNNRIKGFAGDDYLEGGKGNDDIKGGSGADTFAFNSLDGSVDVIKDFSIAEGDRLEVSRSGFGSSRGFSYNESTGSLAFENEQFAILENKPSFSDVSSGFVIT